VQAWLDEDPARATATWVNANPRCLTWDVDGKAHSASGLASHIVEQATGQRIHVTGPLWWVDSDGNRLADVLEAHTGEPVYAESLIERDWSDLHDKLRRLLAGRWTSYGDLASAVGSSAIAVGQHVAVCNDCPNAYRVLDKDGRISEGFSWADSSRDDDPVELLEAEGVKFDANQRAAPEQRMRWS
jgi:alkylated DNA nucleotide flippase Atl1